MDSLYSLLEQKYHGNYFPVYDADNGIWCLHTAQGFEIGDMNYIIAEFSRMSLIYHFFKKE